ncbi:MAG TPA: hypothetical protein PLC99_22495 [Verrucomicrobiota bacterium]|nr:hypothetical protein [Verrucomicrobiota bacterium]
MSEDHPVYIPCASGHNAQTDCCIRPLGDLVELMGYPLMQFTPDDAVHLATAVLHAAHLTGYGGTDEVVARLRSEMAMALHVPVMADSLTRPLLIEASEALAGLERDVDYWMRSAEQWRGHFIHEAALRDTEVDDGK